MKLKTKQAIDYLKFKTKKLNTNGLLRILYVADNNSLKNTGHAITKNTYNFIQKNVLLNDVDKNNDISELSEYEIELLDNALLNYREIDKVVDDVHFSNEKEYIEKMISLGWETATIEYKIKEDKQYKKEEELFKSCLKVVDK